jgi:hypothetical protein
MSSPTRKAPGSSPQLSKVRWRSRERILYTWMKRKRSRSEPSAAVSREATFAAFVPSTQYLTLTSTNPLDFAQNVPSMVVHTGNGDT